MAGRISLLALFVFSLGSFAADDGRDDRLAPPIPSGPPLELPKHVVKPKPTWLEDGEVRPVGATGEGPPIAPIDPSLHPSPPPAAYAGSACNFDVPNSHDVFSPDCGSFQVLFGAYFSGKPGPTVPTFNYTPITFRAGWMLSSPDNEGYFYGNYEFLADLTAAPITSHYGHYIVGPSFYLRKNFVKPGDCIVPYCQLGVGFVLNDAHQDETQSAIGGQFEFYLHGEVGVHFMISQDLSLDIEGGLQHISNGTLYDRNLGVNAFGASVGFT
jgi:hypothetical protein